MRVRERWQEGHDEADGDEDRAEDDEDQVEHDEDAGEEPFFKFFVDAEPGTNVLDDLHSFPRFPA